MNSTVLAEVVLSSYLLANKLGRRTAVLSMSGPKVKAIPATTKGRRRWVGETVIFNKVLKCVFMKTTGARFTHQMKHALFVFNNAYNMCRGQTSFPFGCLRPNKVDCSVIKLARCYSMAAASVKQVNKTSFDFGDNHSIAHTRRIKNIAFKS